MRAQEVRSPAKSVGEGAARRYIPTVRARSLASASIAVVLAFAACGSSDDPPAASASDGAKLYADTCALCHGARGEGYAADQATALANPTFLATASDEYLRRSIARGRPGTTMSAWGKAKGGPYDDVQVRNLVALLRSWQTDPTIPFGTTTPPGDASKGAPTYAARCASCHGPNGTEGPHVRLGNAELLSIATDDFLRVAIDKGRPGTKMPAFPELAGAAGSDVIAHVRSWARPVSDDEIALPGTLGPIVQNPTGPEPAFTVGQRFTPVDVVARELQRGAAMGFLDARAPSDYVAGHVAGAADVPFYQARDYLFALPKDRWLVCYCACPHAESGRLHDALAAVGFTKITILDEGVNVWAERGHPMRKGPSP